MEIWRIIKVKRIKTAEYCLDKYSFQTKVSIYALIIYGTTKLLIPFKQPASVQQVK